MAIAFMLPKEKDANSMKTRLNVTDIPIVLLMVVLVACQPVTNTITTLVPLSTKTFLPAQIPSSAPTATVTPTPIPTIPVSVVELDGAEVPGGFSLIKFTEVYRPTALTFDGQGRMYVTSTDSNIYVLSDDNKDGRADSQSVFATGYTLSLGITVHRLTGDVYVSHQGRITVLQDIDQDGDADSKRTLVSGLPFDLHQNDNLKFGPNGWLYMGIGSTCNACSDPDLRSASIVRFNVDTGESEVYATGLRNPFDIAFHPVTGELFATDNGRDDLGMDAPYEELNHIIQNGDYGYPNCWNAQDAAGCENTIPAVAFFESHSSADGLDFYDGNQFPGEYQGNAFVSIFGSWLKPDVQTGIARVVLSPSGNSYKGETSWFVRFPAGVMPLPLLFGPDDALYVGDYMNGVIYRISYGVP